MMLKINLDVHRSGYKQYKFSFVQTVFKCDFEQATRVRNESGADKLNFHHNEFMLIYGRI